MGRTTVPTSDEATLLRSAITSETMERDRLAQILDEYLAASQSHDRRWNGQLTHRQSFSAIESPASGKLAKEPRARLRAA
jgi:hypothetical protein